MWSSVTSFKCSCRQSSSYCKRIITIPLLDHLLTEMKDRFSSHHQIPLQGLFLAPSVLITFTEDDSRLKIGKLADMHKENFPFLDSFFSELHCWYLKSLTHRVSRFTCTTYSILKPNPCVFSNKKIHAIVCTLPVTACSTERSHIVENQDFNQI